MIGALALAANLLIGPEQPLPSPINEPVAVSQFAGSRYADVAAAGRGFVLAWYAAEGIWLQRLDGTSGAPVAATATRVAIVPLRSLLRYPEPRVASNGDVSVVVWKGASSVFAVTILRDGSATPPREIAAASNGANPAITTFGDEFLIVWSDGKDTLGTLLDSSGEESGLRFTIAAGKYPLHIDGLAVASNGSNAFVTTGDNTFIVRRGASVQTGAAFSSGADSRVVWDGSAYVMAFNAAGLQVAAFDEGGNLLHTPLSFGYGAHITVASDGNGSAAFTDAYDGNVIRMAPGAANIVSRTRSPYSFQDVYGAAWNGTKYLLAESRAAPLEATLTSDLQSFSNPQPVALHHATQYHAAITADDRYFFIGAYETGNDVLARFDGKTFLPTQTLLPSGYITLGHDARRAAAFLTGYPDALGIEIDDDGNASPPVRLGYAAGGPFYDYACGVVPVANTFLTIWTNTGPDGPGALTSHSDLYSGSFDQPVTDIQRGFIGPIRAGERLAALVPDGDHAVVAFVDSSGVVRVVDVDRNGKMISPAIAVSGADSPGDLSMAADSDGHLLILWTLGSALVKGVVIDAASRKIESSVDQLPFGGPVYAAWDGESFLVLASAGLLELSEQGVPRGFQALASPFDLSDLGIASGPLGTAIVYTRDAPDLGDAGPRVFLRMVAPPPTRPRRERPERPAH